MNVNHKIPDDVRQKIYDKYPNPEGLSDILFDARKMNAARRSGAEFGYNLAKLEKIKLVIEDCWEKDKNIPEEQRYLASLDWWGVVVTGKDLKEIWNEVMTSIKVKIAFDNGISPDQLKEFEKTLINPTQ